MYSSSTPSYSIERVNNRTLALEDGLRSANAPKHAIDHIYADSGDNVSQITYETHCLTPFSRPWSPLQ